MPSWNDLLTEVEALPPTAQSQWLITRQQSALQEVRRLRGDRNVLFYASAFLQKPTAPAPLLQITFEEINAFMSVIYGMDWSKQLTLILHTPGGMTNATETIVSYLCNKFESIEVIVPTFAMSAGTMISLASDRIVMGRQSQLGPIDPQMQMAGSSISARAVVEQFDRAKQEILSDVKTAHVWAPILQSVGPALLQEAQNALEYSERMVARWLEQRMLQHTPDASLLAASTAAHFNDASLHKSHGRRIDRTEARAQGLTIEDLEADQKLQDAVLTSYHVGTITFEKSPATKILFSDAGRVWVKNWIQ